MIRNGRSSKIKKNQPGRKEKAREKRTTRAPSGQQQERGLLKRRYYKGTKGTEQCIKMNNKAEKRTMKSGPGNR